MNNKGKITIVGIIFILLVAYGMFVAVKLISSSVFESQISREIKDHFGMIRGGGFSPQKGEKAIKDILSAKEILFTEEDKAQVYVELDHKKALILFGYEYTIETDLIFFKRSKRVTVDEEMRSFN